MENTIKVERAILNLTQDELANLCNPFAKPWWWGGNSFKNLFDSDFKLSND